MPSLSRVTLASPRKPPSAGSAPRSQRATGPISVRQVSGQASHRPLAQDPHISDAATLAGGRLLPLTTRCVSPQQSSRKESAGNSCRHPQGCPTNPTAGDLGRFIAEPGPRPSDLPGAWRTFLSVLSTTVPWAPAEGKHHRMTIPKFRHVNFHLHLQKPKQQQEKPMHRGSNRNQRKQL